jgi:predicted tellurium resistance membrane protein TerC
MKYFAIILRILIIAVWIKMMALWNWTPNTPPFCSGIGFILIWIYLTLQALIWPKAMLCPFTQKCREKMWCKS